MPERPQQWHRNPDEDVRATPQQRDFARKRAAAKSEAAALAQQKAARDAAEDALYDDALAQIKAEEAQRIARNHRLSPGRDR